MNEFRYLMIMSQHVEFFRLLKRKYKTNDALIDASSYAEYEKSDHYKLTKIIGRSYYSSDIWRIFDAGWE